MKPQFGQWALKYRPQGFEQVLGNKAAVAKAQRVVKKKDTHAILMHGPTGCAKTTIARLIANGLTSVPNDIEEINISDKRGIDDVRGLVHRTSFLPQGEFKVFILDEVHQLLGQAQSTLLKELEEPKHDRVVYILCTDRPHMLSAPLLGRLYKIEVEKPPADELAKYLYRIAKREQAFTSFDEEKRKKICLEIVKATNSTPRDSLQLLKQVADEEDTYESYRDLVLQGIRKVSEGTIDTIALQVIMAFYSPNKKLDERASFLANQVFDKDMWGLMTRLAKIHMDVLNTALGVSTPAGRYYTKELSGQKAIPSPRQGAKVQVQLSAIRNNLRNVDMDLSAYVTGELLHVLYSLAGRKREEDDDE